MYMGVNTYTSAGTHMSWVSSRLSPLPCGCAVYVLKVCPGDIAFGGSSSGSCTAREFWKAHILSLRSFADICARLRVFALVAAGWFSAVTTMDGTQKQPRNSLKQLIWSHEIPILNTRMADYVHPRFSSCLNDRTCLRPIHPKWIARENWAKRSSWVPKKCSFKKCARFTGICLFYWNTRVWAQIMKVQIYLLVWRPRYNNI